MTYFLLAYLGVGVALFSTTIAAFAGQVEATEGKVDALALAFASLCIIFLWPAFIRREKRG